MRRSAGSYKNYQSRAVSYQLTDCERVGECVETRTLYLPRPWRAAFQPEWLVPSRLPTALEMEAYGTECCTVHSYRLVLLGTVGSYKWGAAGWGGLAFVYVWLEYSTQLIPKKATLDSSRTLTHQFLTRTLKKISVMHVIKLGFAPVSFPPW